MAAKKTGLIALVVILVAAAAGGGWWWMNRAGGWPGSAEANESVDQPLTAELPASPYATPTPTQDAQPAAAEQFTLAAVIEDPNGFTNVHSGASTVAPIVARVSEGETFSTYEQGDDWWRVRTAGGLIGYMPRRRIRVQGAAAPASAPGVAPPVTTAVPGDAAVPGQPMTTNATPAADVPKAAPPRPRPPRPRSRINRANSANMRAFCQNAGRGTPQCRAFSRELRGR
jgi:hypothetical protein